MSAAPGGIHRIWQVRWTPARLLWVGAFLGAGPALLDAAGTVASNLDFLNGSPAPLPYGFVLLDVALVGLLVPVGLFLVLTGILLAAAAWRPPRRRVFRAALAGAGTALAAGMLLGLLNLLWFLLPLEFETVTFLENLTLAVFAARVAAALGTLVVILGIAESIAPAALPRRRRKAMRIRTPLLTRETERPALRVDESPS